MQFGSRPTSIAPRRNRLKIHVTLRDVFLSEALTKKKMVISQ
jgi:hypothetical protein